MLCAREENGLRACTSPAQWQWGSSARLTVTKGGDAPSTRLHILPENTLQSSLCTTRVLRTEEIYPGWFLVQWEIRTLCFIFFLPKFHRCNFSFLSCRDTSGQGRFCTIFRSYSRGAQVSAALSYLTGAHFLFLYDGIKFFYSLKSSEEKCIKHQKDENRKYGEVPHVFLKSSFLILWNDGKDGSEWHLPRQLWKRAVGGCWFLGLGWEGGVIEDMAILIWDLP